MFSSYNKLSNTQKSSYTSVGVPAALAVSLDTVKNWVGAFDDDSDNAELTSLILAAEKKIRELGNIIISRTAVIDHYKALNTQFLELEYECAISGDLSSIKYIDENNQEQVINSSNYILDTSAKKTRVSLINNYKLGSLDYSKYIENPILVNYFSGSGTEITGQVSSSLDGANLLATAMQMLVDAYSRAKGDDLINIAKVEMAVARLLRNYRLGIG